MGDDAEYQMELDAQVAAEAQLARESRDLSGVRPLFVLDGNEFEEISDQHYLGSFLGVFAALHADGLGLECFQTSGLPDEAPNLAFLAPYVVAGDGRYEVLVVSGRDASAIRKRADHWDTQDASLFDRVSAGLLNDVANYIEHHPGRDVYVFARTICP